MTNLDLFEEEQIQRIRQSMYSTETLQKKQLTTKTLQINSNQCTIIFKSSRHKTNESGVQCSPSRLDKSTTTTLMCSDG